MGLLGITVLLVALAAVSCHQDNDFYGISHFTVVTSDIKVSKEFYTKVFGGMVVKELGTGLEGVYGDALFYRFFDKEYQESQRTGRSLEELKVPDIRESGDHKVVWEFILFPTTMIQLLMFVERETNKPYRFFYERVGNAIIGSSHGCFFAQEDVNALQQIHSMIKEQDDIKGFPRNKKGFITTFPVDSFEEREDLPPNSYLYNLGPSFALSMLRGPMGERWENSYRIGSGTYDDLYLYCQERGVHPTLSDVKQDNKFQKKYSQKNAGFSHFNFVAEDIDETVDFYTRVLGGIQNPRKSGRNAPMGELFQRLIFQDEELELKEENLAVDASNGILNPTSLFDIDFILFDNVYFEPYRYYLNSTFRGILPEWYRDVVSPALINNQHINFWVKDTSDLTTVAQGIASNSASFSKVFLNGPGPADADVFEGEAPRRGSYGGGSSSWGFSWAGWWTNPWGRQGPRYPQTPNRPSFGGHRRGKRSVLSDVWGPIFPAGHDLEGVNFLYFKGPSDEQLGLWQFTGPALATLEAAYKTYGAQSTAFLTTNPWNYDGYIDNCEKILARVGN